ncbi:MAG: T9SS type A sorting domain-containing protein, partial [candidate division WOR-3 bacterium]
TAFNGLRSGDIGIYFTFNDYTGSKEDKKLKVEDVRLRLEVFPNPFKNHCVIKFQIPKHNDQINFNTQIPNNFAFRNPQSEISLSIYDASGRMVKQFNHLTIQPFNQIIWSGDDNSIHPLPSGVYFINLKIPDGALVKKVMKLGG